MAALVQMQLVDARRFSDFFFPSSRIQPGACRLPDVLFVSHG
jgi:hypothetical protein